MIAAGMESESDEFDDYYDDYEDQEDEVRHSTTAGPSAEISLAKEPLKPKVCDLNL